MARRARWSRRTSAVSCRSSAARHSRTCRPRAPCGAARRCRFVVSGMLELRHVQELRGAGSDIPETRRSAMTAWEGRLLAVVTAVLVVFGLAAVYGASSLVTTAGGRVGASLALLQAWAAAGG